MALNQRPFWAQWKGPTKIPRERVKKMFLPLDIPEKKREYQSLYMRVYRDRLTPEQIEKRREYSREYERTRRKRPEGYSRSESRRRYEREWKRRYRSTPEGAQANRDSVKKWRETHKDVSRTRWNAWFRGASLRLRVEAVKAYGGRCSCCGEDQYAFLELDHVNNDGKRHREQSGNSWVLLRELKANGWPRVLQVLCANCHRAKTNYGGCGHNATLLINEAFYADLA